MIRRLVAPGLLSLGLAGSTLTGATAQTESIVHKFRCPAQVTGTTAAPPRIGHDPTYSLTTPAHPLQATFVTSLRDGQKVACVYKEVSQPPRHQDLVYSYTVQRQIVSCQNLGRPEFLCSLR